MKGLLLLAFVLVIGDRHAHGSDVRYITAEGGSTATVVSTAVSLVHTGQIVSTDAKGIATLDALHELVRSAGGDVNQIVKLHVVASSQQIADAARAAIEKAYPPASRPPVTYVVGDLPSGQRLGIDAVAVSTAPGHPASSAARTLSDGPRVYVSGQAEKGATPAEATAKTLSGLLKTLSFVGAKTSDVVQLKCFLTPVEAAPVVRATIDKAFGERAVPVVFVEWKSDLPIEIELIAAAPPAAPDAPAVEYLTPPGMKPSPLFARVVKVNRGDVAYTAGLYANEPGTGEAQVISIFDQLRGVLDRTGSDFTHLAKATYYVSDADASGKLNEVRPKFYDPRRPPAASKAMVPGVGMKDRSIAIDMIGVVVSDAEHAAAATRPVTP